MQKKIALKAEGLQAGYGERNVLSGLDLEVPAGEIFALLGGNGAGKSTLLSVFLGLLKPRAGRVWVGEIDVLRDPEAAPMSAPLPTRFETDINIAAAGLLAPLTALRRVSMATAAGARNRRRLEHLLFDGRRAIEVTCDFSIRSSIMCAWRGWFGRRPLPGGARSLSGCHDAIAARIKRRC